MRKRKHTMENKSALEKFYTENPEYTQYYQHALEEINEKILEANPEIATLVQEFNNELQEDNDEADALFLKMNKLMMELNEVSEAFHKKAQHIEDKKNKLMDTSRYEVLKEVQDVVFAQLDAILGNPEHPYYEIYKQEQQLLDEQS